MTMTMVWLQRGGGGDPILGSGLCCSLKEFCCVMTMVWLQPGGGGDLILGSEKVADSLRSPNLLQLQQRCYLFLGLGVLCVLFSVKWFYLDSLLESLPASRPTAELCPPHLSVA